MENNYVYLKHLNILAIWQMKTFCILYNNVPMSTILQMNKILDN